MGFFDAARKKIRDHFESNKENRERMEELRRETDRQRQQIFETQFKKNALEVAKAQAYKDAAQKSGIQKLRAETRIRRLNESSSEPQPGTWREKLRDFTAQNIVRRQENLKRTEEIREKAEQLKQERVNQTTTQRNQGLPNVNNNTLASRKPNWKM